MVIIIIIIIMTTIMLPGGMSFAGVGEIPSRPIGVRVCLGPQR